MNFDRPLHISHRGGAAIGPENTLPTMRRAVEEFQTDVLEIDVRATRDGVLVIHHDPEVSRTTNGHGPVHETPWAELRGLDAGCHFTPDGGKTYPFRGRGVQIPSLEEVFDAFPRLLFHIDVKQDQPGIEDRVLSLIRARNIQDQVFIGSSCDRVGRRIRRAAVDMATFPSRYGLWKLYLLHRAGLFFLYRFKDTLISIVPEMESGRPVVTPEFVQAIHRRGRKIFVFVVDEPGKQRELLAWGVDGIMSDHPDRLRKTLNEFHPGSNEG